MRSQLIVLCLPLMALVGCAAQQSGTDEWARAESALDDASARLGSVEASMRAVLTRRTYTIRIPRSTVLSGAGPTRSELRPSEAYRALVDNPQLPYAAPIQRLLDRAAARQPVGSGDSLECLRSERPAAPDAPTVFETSELRGRTAARLDVALVVRIERCATVGQQINSPAANMPSDASLAALASEARRKQFEAMDAPFKMARADVRAMMIGQAFLFEEQEDAKIPVSSFMVKQATSTFRAVRDAFAPFATKPAPSSMVFNRMSTSLGTQLQTQPRGWFNAVTTADSTYVSPTILRATTAACAAKVDILPSTSYRIRNEILPDLKARRRTPADVAGATSRAESLAKQAEQCVSDQLAFLIGHELAHQMLDFASEEQADCAGAAVARHLGSSVPGVFGPLIFSAAGTSEAEVLGADANALREILCRRTATWIVGPSVGGDLATSLAACRTGQRRCG